jgi:hypothetical protein
MVIAGEHWAVSHDLSDRQAQSAHSSDSVCSWAMVVGIRCVCVCGGGGGSAPPAALLLNPADTVNRPGR